MYLNAGQTNDRNLFGTTNSVLTKKRKQNRRSKCINLYIEYVFLTNHSQIILITSKCNYKILYCKNYIGNPFL